MASDIKRPILRFSSRCLRSLSYCGTCCFGVAVDVIAFAFLQASVIAARKILRVNGGFWGPPSCERRGRRNAERRALVSVPQLIFWIARKQRPRNAFRRSTAAISVGLPLHKRPLHHKLPRLTMIAFGKPRPRQQRPRVMDQRGTAADHDAVMGGFERSEAGVAEQFA